MSTEISAHPLFWPSGQPRASRRMSSRFRVSLAESRKDLLRELDALGAKNVVISSNLELRRDGLPYSDSREPSDPGIAVYFDRKVFIPNGAQVYDPVTRNYVVKSFPPREESRPFVIACDTYEKAAHNLRAVGATVSALRTIQRHGASSMLEQAFTGFAALPPAGVAKLWWEVLGVERSAGLREIQNAYLDLSKIHHPDVGGDHARMSEINEAFRQAKEEKK